MHKHELHGEGARSAVIDKESICRYTSATRKNTYDNGMRLVHCASIERAPNIRALVTKDAVTIGVMVHLVGVLRVQLAHMTILVCK